MKNAVLLDYDSNTAIIHYDNHTERVQDTNSKVPTETNGGLGFMQQKGFSAI